MKFSEFFTPNHSYAGAVLPCGEHLIIRNDGRRLVFQAEVSSGDLRFTMFEAGPVTVDEKEVDPE